MRSMTNGPCAPVAAGDGADRYAISATSSSVTASASGGNSATATATGDGSRTAARFASTVTTIPKQNAHHGNAPAGSPRCRRTQITTSAATSIPSTLSGSHGAITGSPLVAMTSRACR